MERKKFHSPLYRLHIMVYNDISEKREVWY